MSEQVVKDLRVTAREEGVERVVNRLGALQAASRNAAQAVGEVGLATEASARRTADSTRALDRYAERTSVNSRAVREFARDLKTLDNGLASGLLTAQGHVRELQRIQQNLQNFRIPSLADQSAVNDLLRVRTGVDAVTNAARESARAFEEAFARQRAWGNSLNQGFGFDRLSRDAREAAGSFDELFQNQEKVGRGFRELVNQRAGVFDGVARSAREASSAFDELFRNQDRVAKQLQSGIDARLRVGAAPSRSATDSADAFAPTFRQEDAAVAAYAKRLAEVKAAIDPVAAAQDRFNAEVAEYNALRAAGDLSDQQFLQGLAVAQNRLNQTEKSLVNFGDSAKLGVHEVQNLSYQLNDIGVSLMSGQSPMVVMLQQGAQIAQLFGPDVGILAAIKQVGAGIVTFLSNPLTLAVAGIAALAGALTLLNRTFSSNVRPFGEVLEDHKGKLDTLVGGYYELGNAMSTVGRRSQASMEYDLRKSEEELQRSARRSLERGLPGNEGLLGISAVLQRNQRAQTIAGIDLPGIDQYRAIAAEVSKLQTGLADGTYNAVAFEEALARIANQNQTDKTLQDIVDALISASAEAAAAQRQIDGFRLSMEELNRAETEKVLVDSINSLKGLISSTETAEDRVKRYAASARGATRLHSDQVSITVLERKALDDLREAENRRQVAADLDIQSVRARTGAERALIEQRRIRNELSGGTLSATEIETRATEAYNRTVAESTEEWRRANDARRFAREDALASASAEVETFGMSAGAAQSYSQSLRDLAAYRREAAEGGFAVDPAEEQAIRDAAAAVGQFTDALRLMNMERDQVEALRLLEGEANLVGLPERERQVALAGLQAEAALRRENISATDAWGQTYVQNARLMAETRAEIDKQTKALEKQREAVSNVASTFLDIFTDTSSDGFFDRIMKGLADISRQFAELGKQRLLDMFTGGAVGYTSGFPAPGQRSVAPVGVGGISASGGGVRLYAPSGAQPSNASQAITEQLSANVTKTVSDNLLRNMLGSGKDPSHIRGLNAEFASSLTQMFEAAPDAVRASITINSGFRSVARQAELFEGALKKYGSEAAARKWVAPPGRSQHNFGRAVDLGYGNSTAREWVHANAGRFGMHFPMSHENWHLEPINARSGGNATAMRSAVAGGVVDAQRALASGQAGISASSVPVPTSRPAQAASGGGALGGGLNGLRGFMQSPLGMGGMNAFSAFGAGMSSGSPISGGFSGALGAFGMGLGPIGIIGGAAAGLLGGLFGRRRQRREERRQRQEQERQQQLQAQQQLDQQLPAILELQDTLLDRASGTLTQQRARIDSQIKQYQQLAATAKNSAEQERLNAMAASLDDYMQRQYDELRLTAGSVVQSMMAGRGLEPEFAKAVSAVREQSLTIRNYIADLTAATGAGSAEVQAVTAAGREQLLRTLSGADEVTEIWTRLDSLTGTAAQLSAELQKLGMNAEDAGRAVSDHLNRGIQKMRDDFVRSIADETAEGMGLGYLPQIRALMERRDTMRADAASLGADPALVDRWFGVQARNLLDQAGLLDKEIEPLVRAFPELANVLGDSSAKIERSLADAENDLRTAYQRVKQFAEQLASFRNDIRLDRNLSPLGPEERLLEAQRQFRDQAAKAAAGDAVAQGELIGLSRSYLDEAKSFYTTSEAYYGIFSEVDATLKATEAKAVQEINLAAAQHSALLTLNESVLTIPQALANLNAAQAARDTALGQSLQAYVQAMNPQVAVPSYQAPQAVAPIAPAAPGQAPAGPSYEYQDGRAGNWQTVHGMRLFVYAGEDPYAAYLRVTTAPAPTENIGWGSQYWASNQKRFGGEIGFGFNGLGYQNGGIIGNGIWDRDSVIARHRDGGQVWLAGGEGILTAPAMQRPGVRSFMEAANANRLPEMRMPQIAMPAPVRLADGSRAVEQRLERLEATLRSVGDRLAAVAAAGHRETSEAVERGNATARDQALAAKRRAAA